MPVICRYESSNVKLWFVKTKQESLTETSNVIGRDDLLL